MASVTLRIRVRLPNRVRRWVFFVLLRLAGRCLDRALRTWNRRALATVEAGRRKAPAREIPVRFEGMQIRATRDRPGAPLFVMWQNPENDPARSGEQVVHLVEALYEAWKRGDDIVAPMLQAREFIENMKRDGEARRDREAKGVVHLG